MSLILSLGVKFENAGTIVRFWDETGTGSTGDGSAKWKDVYTKTMVQYAEIKMLPPDYEEALTYIIYEDPTGLDNLYYLSEIFSNSGLELNPSDFVDSNGNAPFTERFPEGHIKFYYNVGTDVSTIFNEDNEFNQAFFYELIRRVTDLSTQISLPVKDHEKATEIFEVFLGLEAATNAADAGNEEVFQDIIEFMEEFLTDNNV